MKLHTEKTTLELLEALLAARQWLQVNCAIKPDAPKLTHGPSDALALVSSAIATLTAEGRNKLANEIQAEQEHGRAKYGSGPDDLAHDDGHAPEHWCNFVIDHAQRASASPPMEWRQHMIKVAGLAVSAVESFDRNARAK